jgi:hypothetical protein
MQMARVQWAETSITPSGAGVGGGEVHCTTTALGDVRPIAAWWKRPRER